MKAIVPPIKSQGIKTKLIPWINDLAPLFSGRWIEPFMGTGVVGFSFQPKKAVLNDINPHLINFYKSIQSGIISPSTVKEFLIFEGNLLSNAARDGYDHYIEIRERFNKSFDPLDFLFLSRAGFNGMIRFNRKGKWNIPFCKKPNRFAQSYVTKIVNQVSNVKQIINENWEFLNVDFSKVIESATEEDLIYCDPPYLGRYVDYYNGWTIDDEERLFSLLSETKAKFILSTWHHNNYRKNEAIELFWNKFNLVTRDHFYHSGAKEENRNSIVEALVFNFENRNISNHNHDLLKRPEQLALF
ncbi:MULTISPECIES: DNA adenine methylase [Leptospira]|uniref:Site-specific DNA-methyltransferase (adenine-specific) n=2 Tax=Leptospira TaxID=171 RepID=A0A9Q8RJZ7_9LEPT|nr:MULTISPECIES: Dam family site-specific DNA-(adenine-N6)-methyltransferase [Leptospira]EKR74144.1 DNA adenine methylase [Leptospira noguchii str. 2006001870]EMI72263.1 DNA adenine methylase [Leptospira noguchii str. Bonito]EMJ87852.1 DNA adenine methylase [Leptospira kirschneri str. JB]EMK20193.1 DNA adenine methylase [Leptospira kirschneri serovar Bulgarica str. Nikolaevo]TQE69944.1 Dam family site-specific DNA-(adenine-N6)-methyltransferase [Leptospira noguchii]